MTVIPIVYGAFGMIPKGLIKRLRGLRNKKSSGDHPIIQLRSTEKKPGDLRRLAVTQSPVKNHLLTLEGHTLKGVEKCAMLVMKSGKRHMTDGMELPNHDKIRTLEENETYKYLGILEANTIKQVQMKDTTRKEYLRRTRKLLETKLSSRNLIKGINTWAVTLDRYSGSFLKWTRDELEQMDQRTRKLMTMHKALHPRDDVDRLYVSRKEGGRGLTSIEDSVDASIQRLEDYIEKHERGLITTIRNDTDNTIDDKMTTRKQKWEEKQLYGSFKRLINNISHQKTWIWLRKGNL